MRKRDQFTNTVESKPSNKLALDALAYELALQETQQTRHKSPQQQLEFPFVATVSS